MTSMPPAASPNWSALRALQSARNATASRPSEVMNAAVRPKNNGACRDIIMWASLQCAGKRGVGPIWRSYRALKASEVL